MSKHPVFVGVRVFSAGLAALLAISAAALGATPERHPSVADSAGFLPPSVLDEAHPYVPARPAAAHPVEKKIDDKLELFIFAVIGDSHIRFAGGPDSRYLKDMEDAPAILANYVRDINAHVPAVNFAVHLGDLTDLGTHEEFAIAKQVMDSLVCPLRPVLGNHDNFQSDHKQGWLDFAGIPSTDYSFDVQGFHFIVIDCTLDPYVTPYVDCSAGLRAWVTADLAANPGKPTIVLSHYNMWQRPWNPMFDTTRVYAEYRGMPELRQILENSGCVVAVINGHVHANRMEVHNGIYYIDVGATLVGPPSIRYFYVYPDKIEVAYAYISDRHLFDRVTALCPLCTDCFDPSLVCAFIDGSREQKQFTIPVAPCGGSGVTTVASVPGERPRVAVRRDADGHIRALVSSEATGVVDISLDDVRGRCLGRCNVWKGGPDLDADLTDDLADLDHLPAGIYFVRASLLGRAATAKMVLIQ